MKKLTKLTIERLPKHKYLTGHEQIVYRCNCGCIIDRQDITIIRLKKKVILRCPYCNSDTLKRI